MDEAQPVFCICINCYSCNYLFVFNVGDLGPAMVCCFTFIILFSFSRGDFIHMTVSVVFYVLGCLVIERCIACNCNYCSVFCFIYFDCYKKIKRIISNGTWLLLLHFYCLIKFHYLLIIFPGRCKD